MKERRFPWLGTPCSPEASTEMSEIRVGRKTYPMTRWREGILLFLSDSRKSRRSQMQGISFGAVNLHLDGGTDAYRVDGEAHERLYSTYCGDFSLDVDSSRKQGLRAALVRFIEDDRIGRLSMHFVGNISLTLSKKDKEECHCSLYRPPARA